MVVDREQKTAAVIDVTIPADSNIRKEPEKFIQEVPEAERTTRADEESKV